MNFDVADPPSSEDGTHHDRQLAAAAALAATAAIDGCLGCQLPGATPSTATDSDRRPDRCVARGPDTTRRPALWRERVEPSCVVSVDGEAASPNWALSPTHGYSGSAT